MFTIHSTLPGSGNLPIGVYMCPRNLQELNAILVLLGFNIISFSLILSYNSCWLNIACRRSLACTKASSWKGSILLWGTPSNVSVIIRAKCRAELIPPCNITVNTHCFPIAVKPVFPKSSSLIGTA